MQLMEARSLGRQLRLPAEMDRLRDAREWACRAAEEFGLDRDGCFQVKLAMSEGVTNAIMHGSGSTRDCIEIDVLSDDQRLVFEIRDAGTRTMDGLPFDRIAEGGRGLELVALVMDEMQLTRGDRGSILRFAKHR